MRLHAYGEKADHILAEPHLALHLGDSRVRRVEVKKREMRLAVLADLVGERFDAPILLLRHLAAGGLNDGFVLLDQPLDLLGGHVGARHENMLVKRHGQPFLKRRRTIRRLDPLPRREALRATFLERLKLDVHTKAETPGDEAMCCCQLTIRPNSELRKASRSASGRGIANAVSI